MRSTTARPCDRKSLLSAIADREDPFDTYHTVVRNDVNQEIASRLIEQLT